MPDIVYAHSVILCLGNYIAGSGANRKISAQLFAKRFQELEVSRYKSVLITQVVIQQNVLRLNLND